MNDTYIQGILEDLADAGATSINDVDLVDQGRLVSLGYELEVLDDDLTSIRKAR